jgi:hypothetical protein
MMSSALHGYPAKCPVCGREFRGTEGTQIVADSPSGAVAHFTCDDCRSSVVVSVRSEERGLVGMGMLTDLNPSEAKRFLVQGKPVSEDDVLGVYVACKESKGGVREMLGENKQA